MGLGVGAFIFSASNGTNFVLFGGTYRSGVLVLGAGRLSVLVVGVPGDRGYENFPGYCGRVSAKGGSSV